MKNTLLKTDEIGIFSLGGLGEVGKNMYIFEISDQIFIEMLEFCFQIITY